MPYSLHDWPIDSKSKTIVEVKSSTKGKRPKMTGHFLYVFLDEGGNFDFTAGGTPYFLFSSIAKERPFAAYQDMTELKYDLIETGANMEYFHAAEDAQATRNRVFDIIERRLEGVRIDSLIIEKRKTGPALQHPEKFYPKMLGYLLRHVLERHHLDRYQEVLVFTDRIPVAKKRNAVEKAVRMTLANMLPKTARYRLLHHDSKSNFDLQIADYCNWAIYRKWDRGDDRSYNRIRSAIYSEFDIFRTGTRFYY